MACCPALSGSITVSAVRDACSRLPAPGRLAHATVDKPTPAAVLVPIVDASGKACVIVTKRPSTMGHHRDDWVFPGGRVNSELDSSSADAARRETHEELGLPVDAIEIIGQLSTHGPIMTGYVVDVFVGILADVGLVVPDPREVEEMLILDLAELTAPGVHQRRREMPAHETGPGAPGWVTLSVDIEPMHFFAIRPGEWLWGTQGTILYELLCTLHDASVRETDA